MTLREHLYDIIFEADTRSGKWFDVALIIVILASVAAVMLDSVASIRDAYGPILHALEWIFTILFTLEYAARIFCARSRPGYIFSFFGAVDLLAILPTYLSLIFPGAVYVAVVRILRVLRIFRILKIAQYVRESETLIRALYATRRKIAVFLFFLLTIIVIFGSLMYIVEGPETGFTSIPRSIYWSIVTLTTVGYGDIAPKTPLGQALASIMMIVGYGIIAVPTGIVTVELARGSRGVSPACPKCHAKTHDGDASYCKYCGERLAEGQSSAL